MQVKRGDIYYVNLSPVVGSEQGGERPVLVIQNDVGNVHSPTVIVAAITTKSRPNLPTHIPIDAKSTGLSHNSIVLLEQVRTIDKKRLQKRQGFVGSDLMSQIDRGLAISLGMGGKV